jgi:alkylhydroperoxidase family enzyme
MRMPIIEPIPMDELPPVSRTLIQDGCDEGLYATPIPLQLFAYSTRQLINMDEHRRQRGGGSLLGGRILELLRIRSAQLGECQPCMQSRKHDSITDEDVACLLDVDGGNLTEQERLAVKFMDLLSADHHAIDREFYAELANVFTAAQIMELGITSAQSMGLHRFIHTLEVFGTDAPVVPYSADQVDTAVQPVGVS